MHLEHMESIHLSVRNWRHTAVSQYHSWHHHHHAHHQFSKDISTLCHTYTLNAVGGVQRNCKSPTCRHDDHSTHTSIVLPPHRSYATKTSYSFFHGTTYASLGIWAAGTLGIKLCSPRPPSGCDVTKTRATWDITLIVSHELTVVRGTRLTHLQKGKAYLMQTDISQLWGPSPHQTPNWWSLQTNMTPMPTIAHRTRVFYYHWWTLQTTCQHIT